MAKYKIVEVVTNTSMWPFFNEERWVTACDGYYTSFKKLSSYCPVEDYPRTFGITEEEDIHDHTWSWVPVEEDVENAITRHCPAFIAGQGVCIGYNYTYTYAADNERLEYFQFIIEV